MKNKENLEQELNVDLEKQCCNSGNKILTEAFDWVETFVTALVFVVILFTFVFRVVTVDGRSMQQTLQDKEKLLLSSVEYTPQCGDIIVLQKLDYFSYPLVKRVIATEGQTVDIDFDTWKVTVDGKVIDEPYVNFEEGKSMARGALEYPLTVSEGHVFVMGDNRNHSSDSRHFGQVDSRQILGKVLIRLLPINKFGKVLPAVQG